MYRLAVFDAYLLANSLPQPGRVSIKPLFLVIITHYLLFYIPGQEYTQGVYIFFIDPVFRRPHSPGFRFGKSRVAFPVVDVVGKENYPVEVSIRLASTT